MVGPWAGGKYFSTVPTPTYYGKVFAWDYLRQWLPTCFPQTPALITSNILIATNVVI